VGNTVTFSVTLATNSSTTGVTYTWTKGGVAVGTNSSTYTITAANADGGVFAVVCTVSHAMGLAVSNPATLTVQVSRLRVAGRCESRPGTWLPCCSSWAGYRVCCVWLETPPDEEGHIYASACSCKLRVLLACSCALIGLCSARPDCMLPLVPEVFPARRSPTAPL
jgi:hypothetical protein